MLWRLYFGCVLLGLLWQVEGQINVVGTGGQATFYLTKSSDCNANLPREIGQSTVQIFGKHSDGTSSVTSCTLTLRSTNIREPYRIKLQFTAVTIRDESTHLYIYDGLPQGNLLRRFSRGENLPSNLDFIFSTGELVTFKFSRGELEFDFDINVQVIPVPSESTNCNYENEGNCGEYGYSYRLLGTKEIAGIVAGGFGLVVIIVVTIICCCYCKQRGVTKKWTEEKLGHINTAASLHSLNGHVSRSNAQTSAAAPKPWSTAESARSNGFASIRRSPSLPRAKIARLSQRGDRDSSVTDSNASLPESRPLPQPGRSTRGAPSDRSYNPRSERSYNPRSERSYGRSKSNEKFRDDRSSEDSGSYTTDRNLSEKNFKPPTYREALRNNEEEDSSADEHTFVQADESSSQKVFIERVIAPRVKQTTDNSPKVHKKTTSIQASPKAARVPPPPEEDMEYDSIEPKKAKLKGLVDRGVDADANEETDESDTENESEEESENEESESEEEPAPTKQKQDKNDYVYSQPDKSNRKDVKNGKKKTANVPEPQVGFRPVPPQGNPHYPPQGNPQYPQQMGPNAMGYPGPVLHHPQAQFPGYPQMGPPQVQGYPPQGQPYYPPPPNMAVQQPRPVVPPSYNQSNFTVPLNQPPQMAQQYPNGHVPDRTNTTKSNPGTLGNQPPVYSYLVNRGFMPMDGRHSPASNSTGASNLSGDRKLNHDDSDYSANIGSGVELMKRK